MDSLTALVATAQRRLRLRRILIAIERHPELLEKDEMATPFLQGLTKAMGMLEHDLETEAKGLTTKYRSVGARGKAAIAKGHTKIDGVASRVAEVDKFVTDLEGANGGDPLDGSSGSSEQPPKTAAVVTSSSGDEAQGDAQDPEHLSVNGVSKDL